MYHQLTATAIAFQSADWRLAQSRPTRRDLDLRAMVALAAQVAEARAAGDWVRAADLEGSRIIVRSRALGLPDPA